MNFIGQKFKSKSEQNKEFKSIFRKLYKLAKSLLKMLLLKIHKDP
jgi:hypothetical protein